MWQRLTSLQTGLTTGSISKSAIFLRRKIQIGNFAPLEAISDNYEKLVLSTDTLLRVNRGGIRQKNIIDFLLEH